MRSSFIQVGIGLSLVLAVLGRFSFTERMPLRGRTIQSAEIHTEALSLAHLRCESRIDPLGVESAAPRLSWELRSSRRNVVQSAYQVLVADDRAALERNVGNVWDSGRVESNQSIQVPYAGTALEPAKNYYWKVRVWDVAGVTSDWSSIARWRMGLLSPRDWAGARWIGYEDLPGHQRIVPAIHGKGTEGRPPRNVLPLLRRSFTPRKPVKEAVAFVSGLGHFDLSLNGSKVGDHFLDPGWSLYTKEALYVTFEVKDQLRPGENVLGLQVGNGFHYMPGERYRKLTGAHGNPKAILRLLLTYEDGTTESIVTDPTWTAAPGPTKFSSIFGGEDYDAREEKPGWDAPGYNASGWRSAVVVDGPRLASQTIEPLRVMQSFRGRVIQDQGEVTLYDFGQNASAIPKIVVSGKAGMKVRVLPGEVIRNGRVFQKGTGEPIWYEYTLKGEGTEIWQPRFTYSGFRYLQVEKSKSGSWFSTEVPAVHSVESLHIRNSARTVGSFESSSTLFNRIASLIDWAVRSNMASVFTDCPHREKLGWLEETHLMAPSIQYRYDIANLGRKSVRDMIQSQQSNGMVPTIAPEYVPFEDKFRDSPEWGSASILLPWALYQWYGDRRILEESYSMMTFYAAYLESRSSGGIVSHGLGDWYDIGPEAPGESQQTPPGVTATAIYYEDLQVLSQVAQVLGHKNDAKDFRQRADQVRDGFNQRFYDRRSATYGGGSQTSNAMALFMGMVPAQDQARVLNSLLADIRRRDSFTTGDVGHRFLLRTLQDRGLSQSIADLHGRSDRPGYGYQLERGATALTESWQALPEVSNNHFMLGHIMEWFYQGLGGIRQSSKSVAFKDLEIRPDPVLQVSSAKTSFLSPYGRVVTDWKKNGDTFTLSVEVPPNSAATVYLPAKTRARIVESDRALEDRDDLKFLRFEGDRALVRVGSGSYRFSVSR